MLTRTVTLLFAMLLAAPGCVEDLGPEDLTGGASSGGDAGADAEGSEAEVEEKLDEDAPAPEALLACDLEMACEHPLELVRSDPAAAYGASDECALKSLAGGATALVQTVAVFPDAEAYLDHVVVDGGVLRQAHGRSDGLGIWQRPVERCALADAAFFAGCLEQFDAACLDPDRWVVAGSCETLGSLTCPRP
jgi:hypothetical protein